jgi:hypothetical protein
MSNFEQTQRTCRSLKVATVPAHMNAIMPTSIVKKNDCNHDDVNLWLPKVALDKAYRKDLGSKRLPGYIVVADIKSCVCFR